MDESRWPPPHWRGRHSDAVGVRHRRRIGRRRPARTAVLAALAAGVVVIGALPAAVRWIGGSSPPAVLEGVPELSPGPFSVGDVPVGRDPARASAVTGPTSPEPGLGALRDALARTAALTTFRFELVVEPVPNASGVTPVVLTGAVDRVAARAEVSSWSTMTPDVDGVGLDDDLAADGETVRIVVADGHLHVGLPSLAAPEGGLRRRFTWWRMADAAGTGTGTGTVVGEGAGTMGGTGDGLAAVTGLLALLADATGISGGVPDPIGVGPARRWSVTIAEATSDSGPSTAAGVRRGTVGSYVPWGREVGVWISDAGVVAAIEVPVTRGSGASGPEALVRFVLTGIDEQVAIAVPEVPPERVLAR